MAYVNVGQLFPSVAPVVVPVMLPASARVLDRGTPVPGAKVTLVQYERIGGAGKVVMSVFTDQNGMAEFALPSVVEPPAGFEYRVEKAGYPRKTVPAKVGQVDVYLAEEAKPEPTKITEKVPAAAEKLGLPIPLIVIGGLALLGVGGLAAYLAARD